MSEKLPSLDDFTESELPSVEEFLKEEETVELPSVEEFVEEEVEEDSITIEDANGNPFLEVTDVVKEGDEVSVKVIGFDRGKVKLSIKQAVA